ncbi:MAG: hypothetical protein ACI311_02185 [Bacilli bacterium]
MSRILSLTSVIFKNSGFANIFNFSNSTKKQSPIKKTIFTIFLLLCFVFVSISIGMFAFALLEIGKLETGYDYEYLKNILLIYVPMYLVLVFSLISMVVLSSFFLSQDNHVYMPLPVKSYELFIARLLNTLITAYAIQIFVVLPCLISFNIVLQPTWIIYINEILFFIFLPIVPLALSLLINCALAKIINLAKYKTLFSFLSFIVTMGLILAIELLSSTSLDISEAENAAELIASFKLSIASLANNLRFFSFYIFLPNAGLTDPTLIGVLYSLLFGIISFAIMFIVIVGFGPSYGNVLVKTNDNYQNKKKKISQDSLDVVIKNGTKSKTVLGTYIMKEYKDIVRSNTNVIQLVVPPFLILVIGAISIFVTIFGQESSATGLQTIIANMRSLITFDSGFLIFFVTAFALFLSSMTLISACSISREGKNASLLKYVPVSPFVVMISKIFWGIVLTSGIEIIVILGLGFGLNIHWSIIVLCIITSISATILANIIMYMVDLSRPYLDWVNEIDPIKQNMNVLFSLLACWAVAIVFIVIGYLSMLYNVMNIFVAASIIIGICFIIILSLMLYMRKNKTKIFDKIQ